jgi:hypothetical protein
MDVSAYRPIVAGDLRGEWPQGRSVSRTARPQATTTANVNRGLRARGVGWSIIGASKEAGTICRICGLQQR